MKRPGPPVRAKVKALTPPAEAPRGLVPVDRSKLVKVDRSALAAPTEAVPALEVPDQRDMRWWIDPVSRTKPGRYRAPAAPTRPEETLVVETEEQFNLLQPAVDAVEANKDFLLADNTKAAYASEWRVFVLWATARGQKVMPAAPRLVQAYIADMAARERPRVVGGERAPDALPLPPLPPRKPGGLRVALSAIRHYHKHYKYPSPTDDDLVKDELRSIRRRVGVRPVRKSPLTVEHLEQIVEVLEAVRGDPQGRDKLERRAAARRTLRDKAIVLLGFAGAFRRNELSELDVRNIAFRPEGLDAILERSKTDQEGAGFVKGILKGKRESVCPQRALEHWLAEMKSSDNFPGTSIASGPVFREIDRWNRLVVKQFPGMLRAQGLSGGTIALVVKEYVQKIGLDPEGYSGHSLRAGFITAAVRAGHTIDQIMKMSGHEDPSTVVIYIRSEGRFKDSAGEGLL